MWFTIKLILGIIVNEPIGVQCLVFWWQGYFMRFEGMLLEKDTLASLPDFEFAVSLVMALTLRNVYSSKLQ